MGIVELGAVGELVGGLGVIATLAYLAIQIRQSAQSTRFLATQGLIAGQADSNLHVATHGDLAGIILSGVMADGDDPLTPKERHRFNLYMVSFYVQVDFAYHQYRAGQLAESVWKRMVGEMEYFHLPGLARWWSEDKTRFSPEFVDFVDRQIATSSPPAVVPSIPSIDSEEEGR